MTSAILRRPGLLIIGIAFLAFISLGLNDGLLSIALPFILTDFGVPIGSFGMATIAGTLGYTLSSFNSGRIIARLGVGRMLALSCALAGGAVIGFTLVPLWAHYLILVFWLALGFGAIDAGLNTYVAGNHGPGLMQWLHASFGVGTVVGSVIITTSMSAGQTWRFSYVVVGVMMIALAGVFVLTARRWVQGSKKTDESKAILTHRTPPGKSLRRLRVQLSALAFFLYAGVEISAARLASTVLIQSRGIASDEAGWWMSAFWTLFTIGRILSGVVASRVRPSILIRLGMGGALVGTLLFWLNPVPVVGLIGLVVIGFSTAPIFASLTTSTAERVGVEHAANTIGFQVAATGLGGAVMPTLASVLAQSFGLEMITVCLVGAALGDLLLYETIIWLQRREAQQLAEASAQA